MSLPVFLLEAPVPDVGQAVALDGDEGRHAVTVKRIRVGESIELTDGQGVRGVVRVDEVGKARLTGTVMERRVESPSDLRVTVVQAIPKGERGELAVEMLTEIDVDRIIPWAAARSVAVWKGERAAKSLARWRATARAATKQARRAWLPAVAEPHSLAAVVAVLAAADLAVVLHEDATEPLAALQVPTQGDLVIVVGPEGGIAPEELAAFAEVGVRPVRLGSSVLRTSTAGVAAAAALLARTPRWA